MSRQVLINLGNSQIVIWLPKERAFHFCPQSPKGLRRAFQILMQRKVMEVHVLSVVPASARKLAQWSRAEGMTISFYSTADLPRKTLRYVKGLGIDRAFNILAAQNLGFERSPIVIVDIGTAMTVDFLDEKKRHKGGWICAGPRLLSEALSEKTAQLPRVDPAHRMMCQALLGSNSTVTSLQNGSTAQTIGVIELAFELSRQKFGKKPRLVLTGGWAPRIKLRKPISGRRVPHLALRGLKDFIDNRG